MYIYNKGVPMCMYVCMYIICMYVCIDVYVCIHVCIVLMYVYVWLALRLSIENVYFTDGRYLLIFRNKYKTMGGLMLVCILHRMLRRT